MTHDSHHPSHHCSSWYLLRAPLRRAAARFYNRFVNCVRSPQMPACATSRYLLMPRTHTARQMLQLNMKMLTPHDISPRNNRIRVTTFSDRKLAGLWRVTGIQRVYARGERRGISGWDFYRSDTRERIGSQEERTVSSTTHRRSDLSHPTFSPRSYEGSGFPCRKPLLSELREAKK